MISVNCMILPREIQSSIAEQTKQLFTHLARVIQREKSKGFPAEGVTIYKQLDDKRIGTGLNGEATHGLIPIDLPSRGGT
jgi:hypothetical protein